MRVYTNPEKLKRIKEKNKKSKPLSYEYHISEEGEKIKYIPCNFKQLKKKIPTVKEKDYKDKLSYVRVL